MTWNVWGRWGDWRLRQDGIESTLVSASPDLVCLTEAWSTDSDTQAERVARRLGYDHHAATGGADFEGWTSGFGLVSRWPIERTERVSLDRGDHHATGSAFYAQIEGDRGTIDLFTVILHYPLDASAERLAQVGRLASLVEDAVHRRRALIVCGDFNAGPDSDELRVLTGRSAPLRPGVVFYDAWEMAGDGGPGHTWSNRNPLAAISMFPNRRLDYVLSAWPRKGGLGHPTRCELLGVRNSDLPQLSDHYGVLADLRY